MTAEPTADPVPSEPRAPRELLDEVCKVYETKVMERLERELPDHDAGCDRGWDQRGGWKCLRCKVVSGMQVTLGFAHPVGDDPPAGARLLALAAVGQAADRLPQGWLIGQFDDGGWGVFSHDMSEVKGHGPTLPAAVEAALGEQP